MQRRRMLEPLYLSTTIDHGAYLTLIAKINLLNVQPLVDLEAIGYL